jgi:hypothetical protein
MFELASLRFQQGFSLPAAVPKGGKPVLLAMIDVWAAGLTMRKQLRLKLSLKP